MGGAGDLAQRLRPLQLQEGRMDGRARHPGPLADRAQGPHRVGDLGHPAEAAARTAFQRALAGERQGLLGHGLQHHIDRYALRALLDRDVLDVGGLGDGLGDGETHHQVLDVPGRGHQHRVRAVVVGDADRRLVGRDALDLADLRAADAPLEALAFHRRGEAFH